MLKKPPPTTVWLSSKFMSMFRILSEILLTRRQLIYNPCLMELTCKIIFLESLVKSHVKVMLLQSKLTTFTSCKKILKNLVCLHIAQKKTFIFCLF